MLDAEVMSKGLHLTVGSAYKLFLLQQQLILYQSLSFLFFVFIDFAKLFVVAGRLSALPVGS